MADLRPTRRLILGLALALAAGDAMAAIEPFAPRPRPTPNFPDIGYSSWSDDEPAYRFYPGDEIEVTVLSAPELNRSATVGPDGRIALPLIGSVMAADRSVEDLQATISAAYASQLLRPQVSVAVRTAGPLRVFVGGEVDRPGVIEMPGDIDALRAILMAGGFKTTARRNQVVIIRRGRDNRPMMRVVDLTRIFSDPAHTDLVPLRRFDIVYVPRTRVAEAGLFIQQWFRDLSPIQFGFNYAIGGVQ
jgi:polysaccharide export outer membrane protein